MYSFSILPFATLQSLMSLVLGFAATMLFALLLGSLLFWRSWAVPPSPEIAPLPAVPVPAVPVPAIPAPEKEGRAPAPALV